MCPQRRLTFGERAFSGFDAYGQGGEGLGVPVVKLAGDAAPLLLLSRDELPDKLPAQPVLVLKFAVQPGVVHRHADVVSNGGEELQVFCTARVLIRLAHQVHKAHAALAGTQRHADVVGTGPVLRFQLVQPSAVLDTLHHLRRTAAQRLLASAAFNARSRVRVEQIPGYPAPGSRDQAVNPILEQKDPTGGKFRQLQHRAQSRIQDGFHLEGTTHGHRDGVESNQFLVAPQQLAPRGRQRVGHMIEGAGQLFRLLASLDLRFARQVAPSHSLRDAHQFRKRPGQYRAQGEARPSAQQGDGQGQRQQIERLAVDLSPQRPFQKPHAYHASSSLRHRHGDVIDTPLCRVQAPELVGLLRRRDVGLPQVWRQALREAVDQHLTLSVQYKDVAQVGVVQQKAIDQGVEPVNVVRQDLVGVLHGQVAGDGDAALLQLRPSYACQVRSGAHRLPQAQDQGQDHDNGRDANAQAFPIH